MSQAVLRSSTGRLKAAPATTAWDALFVLLPFVYGAALVAVPSIPLIAVGLWWTANTIAHNFIHRPFFARRELNVGFSLLLTSLLGIPQTLWRQRHLAHHADRAWRLRWSPMLAVEIILVSAIWAAMIATQPAFFATVYLPGYATGLLLCAVQGFYEHAHGTTSHYGRLYNIVCFNDGYHAEHHSRPGAHWRELPERTVAGATSSRWPPLLRWLESASVQLLERPVLHSRVLQRFVLGSHRRAFEQLLDGLPAVERIGIVGGGLFPRTALILRALRPAARLIIIDANAGNLAIARSMLGDGTEFVHRRYSALGEQREFDLLVIPLSFEGGRDRLYSDPPAAAMLVHDWIWRSRGTSCVVSPLLCKRLNLVRS